MLDNLNLLEENIIKIQKYISKEEGKREELLRQIELTKKEVLILEEDVDLLEKVNILFQKTSEFAREQAKVQIESLVTKCLQYIFESDIEFKIELEELRGKTNAEFYVVSNSDGLQIKTRPELSRGGGVVDIVSLALRIAFLQIHKPKIEGPLILDEPAKHVSDEYIYNVGDFLKQTSEMFGRQVLIVTHNNHLSAMGNKSYLVDLDGSISKVTSLEEQNTT